MNFEDFYKPQILHKKKLAKHLELKGFIKKKKEKSMTRKLGLLDKSQKQYFQFFDEGRILAYFEQDPEQSKIVYNYIYMADVNKVQDNLDGKKDHFGLVTDNGTLTFKCEDEKQRKKWISAMKFFAAMFSPIGNQQCKDLVEDINIKTITIINKELEMIQWEKHKKFLDQGNFIKAKGLVPIFTKNDQAILKHRILISNSSIVIQSKEKEEEQKKEQREKNSSLPNKRDSQDLKQTSNQYLMIITQKQSYKLDQKYKEKEKIILKKSDLILGYDFDTIYMFNLLNADDYSPSHKQIQMQDIQGVWIEESKQSIKLISNQENIFLKYQTCIEVVCWMETLDKCYDESFQKQRLSLDYIKYDVDFFYEVFLDMENPKRFQSLLDALNKLPKKEDEIEEQLAIFQQQHQNIKDLIECFYSNKPFYAKMYLKIMNYLNKEYLGSMNNFWKMYIVKIESDQILALMKILDSYYSLLKEWKFVFKYNYYQDSFFNCYLGKEFQEQNENIYNILSNFQENTTNLNDALKEFKECIIRQTDAIQYFNQRKQILQLYQNISIIIGQFFSYILNVLQENTWEIENIIDIINQSFQDYFQEIVDTLVTRSQKKMSQVEVQQIVIQDDLQQQVQQIKQICIQQLQNKLKQDLDTKISFPEQINKVDINNNLKRPLREIIEKIQKIKDDKMSKNLIGRSVNQCCDKYISAFLNQTDQINNNNKEDVALQLSSVQNCFRQLLKDSQIKKQNVILRVKYLLKLYQTNNLDEFIMYILKLNVFSKEFTQQENVKKLLRTKIYFPQQSIDYLREFFENIQTTQEQETMEEIQQQTEVQQDDQKKAKINQKEKKVQERKNKEAVDKEDIEQTYDQITSAQFPLKEECLKFQGHVEVAYVSNKAKKTNAKKHLTQLQKDNSNIKKKFLTFEIGSMVLFFSRNQEYSDDYFPYVDIKSLAMLDENKIFLKTSKKCVLILFENTNVKNCEPIYKALEFFKARYKSGKNPVRSYKLDEIDVKWSEIQFSYKFDFDKLKQKQLEKSTSKITISGMNNQN